MRSTLVFVLVAASLAGCGEGVVESDGTGSSGSSALAALLNLNTASAAELDGVDGLTRHKTELIVADREANGPFFAVSEVVRVRGIGAATLRRIRSHVTVGTMCGGIAGLPCAEGELCTYAPGSEEIADAAGICLPGSLDPCAAVRCMFGYVCDFGACIAEDPCMVVVGNHLEPLCGEGESCVLQEVQCIRAPCPPIPSCEPALDACALVRCAAGTTCQDGACIPDVQCGGNVCGAGEYCCNSSCGICAPEGGVCTQQFCG